MEDETRVDACRIRLVGVTLGLVANGALAAPGDLDPSFGNVGRVYDFDVPTLWSLDVQDDGAIAFGGGEDYCGWYYTCDEDAGFGRLLATGAPDATFSTPKLASAVVYDTTLQPDGKLLAVGVQRKNGQERLVVARLLPSGALDTDFATGGTFLMPDSSVGQERAVAVLLEDDGRIVVLGNRGSGMVMVRLTSTGALDATFGTGGIATPGTGIASAARLAHAAGPGYRVLANMAVDPDTSSISACYVLGLTESGAPDPAYGVAGVAAAPAGQPQVCRDFAVAGDGAIVLGGAGGKMARLLPTGLPDGAYAADALPGLLDDVATVRLGSGGRLYVAGNGHGGLEAVTVVRLLADGTLDTVFGDGGSSEFAMPSDRPRSHLVHDMKVVADDALLLGGGTYNNGFVVRLLGDDGGAGPGIVTIAQGSTYVTEQDGHATVRVRRIGGSAGAITVDYATESAPGGATAGSDYTAVSGTLSWADGEAGEQEITVPILADTVGENQEGFVVALHTIEGAARFGASMGDVYIAGSSYPHGSFVFSSSGIVYEGGSVQVWVSRQDYCSGAVSVTVHLQGGTAQVGSDFHASGASGWSDVTLTWADGQCGSQGFTVETVADKDKESVETVTFELTSPTGGAEIGPQAQSSVSIRDPARTAKSGGGALGGVGLALLGLLAALRRRMRRAEPR